MVDGIRHNSIGFLDFHCILSKCRIILSTTTYSLVSFSRRQVNHVTHSLARATWLHARNQTFYHILNRIHSLIMNEMSNLILLKKESWDAANWSNWVSFRNYFLKRVSFQAIFGGGLFFQNVLSSLRAKHHVAAWHAFRYWCWRNMLQLFSSVA